MEMEKCSGVWVLHFKDFQRGSGTKGVVGIADNARVMGEDIEFNEEKYSRIL